jgi:hypothetical protein
MIYANDPRTPQNAVLHLLNRAAKAQQDNDPGLARELVRQALNVFEEGVRRHYYLTESRDRTCDTVPLFRPS